MKMVRKGMQCIVAGCIMICLIAGVSVGVSAETLTLEVESVDALDDFPN